MKMNRFWMAAVLSAGCALSAFAQEAATVARNRVNVRGQPTTNSEVLTQLNEGDKVTVFEEIAAENPKAGEPAVWAKIQIPANVPVWVFSSLIDEDHTVKGAKVNLRAGPGENYSVLGRLEKGAKVTEIRAIEDWMEIEAPESVRVYVDASYLTGLKRPEIAKPKLTPTPSPAEVVKEPVVAFEPKKPALPEVKKEEPKVEEPKKEEPKKEEPVVVAKKEESAELKEEKKEAPPVEVVKVEEPKPAAVAAAPTPAPATPVTAEPADKPAEITRVLPEIGKPTPSAAKAEPASTKRIVRREGKVHSTRFNPQAPTYFELVAEDGTIINYLVGDKSGFVLKDYKGLRVIVTGEESIDKRYPKRPLLEVETIEVAP